MIQLERASDLSGTVYWTNRYSSVDGSLLEVISPTGETNSFVYDDLDNVKTNRFPDGNLLINYYDAENRLASNALPSGASLHYKYDFAGRITNRVSSIGENAHFEYNGNDAVTLITDNTGTTTNLYDAAGRLIGINYPTGASIHYELDKLDRITAITNRASASDTAYISRYAYDAIGNITNVTDPFNGQTAIEYDRVGRRTKRILPNGITSEWQYNWRDQVTNIVHKNSASTVLASVAYERAPFGEPTKITREDGSHVVLKYDAALRLTNEQHYASGGLIENIGYGYDASGSRIRLSSNSGTFTNTVDKGYRVTTVKRQSDGSTTDTYGYDIGGRITSIARSGAALTLGYNTADQLTAVTNGATWTRYTHDGAGRRTKAVDQSGAQRRFLLAGMPASDLESPHLITDANNALKQAYVYIGDQPITRFDSGGSSTRVYYLEDGMGSIIGLAPDGSPDPINTARLFYDGFGTTRSTNGPAPTTPNGAGGDFRFHGAWWESASDLYHMRAREYDPRNGRFLSRDPEQANIRLPETVHPYCFANSNPQIFTDPTGAFSLIEIAFNTGMQMALRAPHAAAGHVVKQRIRRHLGRIITRQVENTVRDLIPAFGLPFPIPGEAGDKFEKTARDAFRGFFCSELYNIPEWIFIDVPISPAGKALADGITCNRAVTESEKAFNASLGVPRPDFVIGAEPPTKGKSWLIGDFKGRTGTLYHQYLVPGTSDGKKQLQAIINYAQKRCYSKTSLFVVATAKGSTKVKVLRKELMKQGVAKGTMVLLVVIIK